MLSTVSEHIQDVSVLRNFLFAIAQLPEDLPNKWYMAVEFSVKDKKSAGVNAETAKVLGENLLELDTLAFSSDKTLFLQLLQFPKKNPLGVVLLSKNEQCTMCYSKLVVRKDRPSPVVIYDDQRGTLPGSHFHKTCTNTSCDFTQYYGYYTTKRAKSSKDSCEVFFYSDWHTLAYFISTRETVFTMSALSRFNSEILLGQQVSNNVQISTTTFTISYLEVHATSK